ncbi:MAG TPA: M50 family metallopeptidase, partial [Kiritimatiellia bacterium]
MRGSIPFGRVLGIRIRVHITFLLLLVWFMWMGWELEGMSGGVWSAVLLLSLFLCVLLHEFGHCIVAMRFGVRTHSITLLPIGGVANMDRIPERPLEEFLIAVAGPLVNVVIAAAFIAATGHWPDMAGLEELPHSFQELVPQIIRTNIILVLFNMIPAYPMDGGRVLRSLLATVMEYGMATTIAARVGQFVSLGFVLFGMEYSPLLPLIGLFIFWAAG